LENKIAPKLWFKPERTFPTPGGTCKGKAVLSRPICINGVPGSGWKFDVVTGAEEGDRDKIGEILTVTRRTGRKPYVSTTFMPTLLTSGLKAGAKIAANESEFLFYMEFLFKVREELLHRWPTLKVSPRQQDQLEAIIEEIRLGLMRRRTDLPLQATSMKPRINDSRGRPNPRATSASITAMHRRLTKQVELEGLSAESMRKRRVFAATLLRCYSQDIWDMRHMDSLRPPTRAAQLQLRLDRALIKPTLFAGLYCQREFGDNLGHPMVLPRIMEVFSVELQLTAIRDLFASLAEQPNGHKENLHKLRVILAMKPSEQLYVEFFDELQQYATEIGTNFRRDPETVGRLATKAKVLIRNRASSQPSHPWFVQTSPIPRP
jgi:hypothetical protein